MKEHWYRWVLVAVTGVSLVVSGYLGYQRHLLEQDNRTVEIAVVYDEMRELAAGQGMATGELLGLLKERGVTSVLVKEPVADESRRLGELAAMKGRELSLYRGAGFGPLQPDHTYIISDDREVVDRVARQLRAKGVAVYELPPDGEWYGLGTPADLLSPRPPLPGLGFPERAVREIDGAGLNVMVQLRSWPGVTQQGLKEVFEPLHDIPNLTALLFNDESVPGNPEFIPSLGHEVKELGVPVAQIEFTPQKGLNRLGLLLDKHMVRLHTISSGEMLKYTPAQALDRYLLAATERNMRILLVRPITSAGSADPIGDNLLFIERLAAGLESEGLEVGKASTFGPLDQSRPWLFVVGLGVVAGLMLLLDRLGVRPRYWLAAGLALTALWLLLLVVGQVTTGRKLMALTGVLVFPILALVLNLRREGTTIPGAVLLLLKISLVTLTGAALMVGLLADVGFMLKLEWFSGVNLAIVLPLAVAIIYYFFATRPGGSTWVGHTRKFLNTPITALAGAIAALLLMAVAMYLIRAGNEGVGMVSSLEMQMRSALDTWLGVRPRTKEFLLGHPVLLLLIYTGLRDNRYIPLLVLGAFGQISLINTFAHIHTPLLVSLARAFNGLWLGALVGLALIAALIIAKKLWEKYVVE